MADPPTPAGVAAAALDVLPDGVLVVAGERVLFANRALCRILGVADRELIGEPVPAAIADLAPERHPCELPNGLDGEVVTIRDRTAQSAREARLLQLASRDGLTGLLNKTSFMHRLADEAAVLGATERPLGLVMVDLDHFKLVNDRHGHPAGDRVLREAAARLKASARTVDTVGRLGGEEFAWLLPDASPAETRAAAHRLSAAMRDTPFADGIALTASIGVCDLATAGSADRLLDHADEALYWAKAHGRDAVLTWTPEAARRLQAARGLEGPTDERLAGLAALCEAEHPGHGRRVAALAVALAARLDWDPHQQARLHRAALLHDLGKTLLPAEVLGKRAPLDAAETAHVRQHPGLGAAMAAGVLDPEQQAWIRGHHERFDGRGYPDGLAAGDVPGGAQLIGIADAWDAMTHDRPQRVALPADEALAEVDRCAGAQLLPGAGDLLRDGLRWWDAAPQPA